MTNSIHHSAKASHYDKDAESYDTFNEKNSRSTNQNIERILKKYKVKTVLDLTCGTGPQVFWLAKCGYKVTGSDINKRMLKVAKDKAKREKVEVKLLEGDMRTVKVGKFDAILTIFNAIGHLTKADFDKAMRNIKSNLSEGGIYVFDIFNLEYLLNDGAITKLTIDWQKTVGDTIFRDIQYSTIDQSGVLASYTTSYKQKGSGKAKISKSMQTLQIYTAKELSEMLTSNGFKVLHQCTVDGARFYNTKSDRILIVAKKNS
ncbi:MAG: class I SAM-dependent methyltransferase [Oligoflexia bacterium]|nr:class I SAM-dependent methyltransferase [Oligoflexia bacterium]MBF0366158.1 class I SAM-dependent methyltransferase [Oligoflexia bacterium]